MCVSSARIKNTMRSTLRRCEMSIRAIRSEADYEAALTRINDLMDAEGGTPEGEELDVLTDLVELYEAKHVPMGFPSPLGAIRFRMEQSGLSPRDLIPFMGSDAILTPMPKKSCVILLVVPEANMFCLQRSIGRMIRHVSTRKLIHTLSKLGAGKC